jgi:hypothetical protein
MSDPETEFGRKAGEAIVLAARAQDIADQLIGTCKGLYEVALPEEIDDPDFMSEFGLLAFECDCCGWWASIDGLHNENGEGELCDECAENEI